MLRILILIPLVCCLGRNCSAQTTFTGYIYNIEINHGSADTTHIHRISKNTISILNDSRNKEYLFPYTIVNYPDKRSFRIFPHAKVALETEVCDLSKLSSAQIPNISSNVYLKLLDSNETINGVKCRGHSTGIPFRDPEAVVFWVTDSIRLPFYPLLCYKEPNESNQLVSDLMLHYSGVFQMGHDLYINGKLVRMNRRYLEPTELEDADIDGIISTLGFQVIDSTPELNEFYTEDWKNYVRRNFKPQRDD